MFFNKRENNVLKTALKFVTKSFKPFTRSYWTGNVYKQNKHHQVSLQHKIFYYPKGIRQ